MNNLIIVKHIVVLHIVYQLVIFVLVFDLPAYSYPIRGELEQGILVVSYPSYKIFIECYTNSSKDINKWLSSYLKNPNDAKIYKKANSFVIPLNKFKESLYPTVFLKLFEKDMITQEGWVHTIPEGYKVDKEELNLISIALTGTLNNATKIILHPANRGKKLPLKEKDKIIIPLDLLLNELKNVKGKTTTSEYPLLVPITPEEDLNQSLPENTTIFLSHSQELPKISHPELKYGKDKKGEYYSYKLKKGETIYRHVIPRFTLCRNEKEKVLVSREILDRSGIKSEKQVKEGTIVKIPANYIRPDLIKSKINSSRTSEKDSRDNIKIKSLKSLENVVVVIDPGHGGKDHGAPRYFEEIYEDEINYDIAVRLRKYLLQNTSAKVYITLKDISQGFEPYEGKTFTHDKDEFILVTPEYNPQDKNSSAHLRWILANSIMRKNEKAGIPRDKMVFISIHFDSLPTNYKGVRIFIPSASHRIQIESPKSKTINFTTFAEWKENKPRVLTASEKIKDEVRSRRFAHILAKNCKNNNIVTYNMGDSIQELINKSPKSSFVPAVLRNTEIPTKVLIECANLNNPSDLSNASDPKWRQKFAETIGESIIEYFKE